MKVYKYLFSVIVMLGLISCSSEESDFENDVVSTVGQYTVAFNLSNDITTKTIDGFTPTTEEMNIEYFTLFICESDNSNAKILKKMFFNGNSCTFNLKLENNKTEYYAYAVANVTDYDLAIVAEKSTLAELKNATASIGLDGVAASMLPKVGGKKFKIEANTSDLQNIGNIDVYQLVSSLQLQIKTKFVGGTNPKFVVREIKWNNFSAEGKIGGVNVGFTNDKLGYLDLNENIPVNSNEFADVGSEFYTFPNITEDAVLYVAGDIYDDGVLVETETNLHAYVHFDSIALAANTKYKVLVTVDGILSKDTQISLGYEVLEAESITVNVPTFE